MHAVLCLLRWARRQRHEVPVDVEWTACDGGAVTACYCDALRCRAALPCVAAKELGPRGASMAVMLCWQSTTTAATTVHGSSQPPRCRVVPCGIVGWEWLWRHAVAQRRWCICTRCAFLWRRWAFGPVSGQHTWVKIGSVPASLIGARPFTHLSVPLHTQQPYVR